MSYFTLIAGFGVIGVRDLHQNIHMPPKALGNAMGPTQQSLLPLVL